MLPEDDENQASAFLLRQLQCTESTSEGRSCPLLFPHVFSPVYPQGLTSSSWLTQVVIHLFQPIWYSLESGFKSHLDKKGVKQKGPLRSRFASGTINHTLAQLWMFPLFFALSRILFMFSFHFFFFKNKTEPGNKADVSFHKKKVKWEKNPFYHINLNGNKISNSSSGSSLQVAGSAW